MTGIRLDLDTTDFAALVEAARAVIPANAAGWTDHNVHDPGIMLIELLAHVADTQIYALSRLRQDERMAFAAILNTSRSGPKPARVLLWPRGSGQSGGVGQLAAFAYQPVSTDLVISSDVPGTPPFRCVEEFSLSGIWIDSARTETDDGQRTDWGDPGRADATAFRPFAADPTSAEALILRCRMAGPNGWLAADGTLPLALGIEVMQPGSADKVRSRRYLSLSVRQDGGEVPVRLRADGTRGLFCTGVLTFDRPQGLDTARSFELVLRPAGLGLIRSPRLRRIAFDVISVEQAECVTETVSNFGTGLPDQVWKPERQGLVEPDALKLRTLDVAGVWRVCMAGDLAAAGPDATVFWRDHRDGTIHFGNGVNGRAPAPGELLDASYMVTDGARGNLAIVAGWTVRGMSGPVWFNPLPALGGADAETLLDLQARVRRNLAGAQICVTGEDLVAAVRELHGFEADALLLRSAGRAGMTTELMAWQIVPKESPDEPDGWQVPTRAWLGELRAKLRDRLPLGLRIEVVPPVAVRIGVRAALEIEPRADAVVVLARCRKMLRRRLAARTGDVRYASLAAPKAIALSAVRGWLRAEPGVRAVRSAVLLADGKSAGDTRTLRPRERCVPEIPEDCLWIVGSDAEDPT